MEDGFGEKGVRQAEEEDACVAGASIADILRILSSGATGAILMALGDGPLRTKELTERVPGYSARTIYRYSGKLAELEVVEREEEGGVPSKVEYTLTDPCGKELHDLIDRFAKASLTLLPDGKIASYAWASLALLADLWESGMVEELACDPQSPTELAKGEHGLSYHQVNRRAGLFKTAGLVCEMPSPGRQRCYALTDQTRRSMGLIAGVGRWRHHHVIAEDEEGMTGPEMATALRASLPLVRMAEDVCKCMRLNVLSASEAHGAEGEAVWAEVEEDGAVHSCPDPTPHVEGWARGRIKNWIPVLLEGELDGLLTGGDVPLVCGSLGQLYEVLWAPKSEPVLG